MADEPTGTTEGATGTTAPAADGSASPAVGSGPTQEQLQARISELERQREQDLSRLSSGEEARRQLQEMQARLSAQPPPTAAGDQHLVEAWNTLATTMPEVAAVLAAKEQVDQKRYQTTQAQIQWDREMASIPAEDRESVRQRAEQLNVSPQWAQKDLNAERWNKERGDLAERERKLREDEQRRNNGVVRTTAAPSPPAPPNNDSMKASDYALRQRQLQAEGKMDEAIALKRRREAGELKVLDG